MRGAVMMLPLFWRRQHPDEILKKQRETIYRATMSPVATEATLRDVRDLIAIGGEAEKRRETGKE